MERALNLIEEELVGATDDDGHGGLLAHALEEHVLPVTNLALLNLGASAEVLSLVALVTILDVGKGDNDFGAGRLGDTAEIEFLDTTDSDDASLDEILEGEIVDTARAENDVGTSVDEKLAALFADVHLLLANLVELLSILAENCDAHLEAELVEVEVNAGDLAVLENLGHALGTTGGLEGVTLNGDGLFGGETVGLQDVHVLDGVLDATGSVGHLDLAHGANDHLGEEVRLSGQELGAHGSLGSLDDRVLGELGLTHNKGLLDEVDRLFQGHTVARHNAGGVNLVLDELVSAAEQLGGKDDDGGGTITDFTILDLGKLDEDLSGGVRNLKLLEDSGAIIGDGDIANVVDKHLVEALGTKRRLDDVGETGDSHDVLCANVLALLTLTEDTDLSHFVKWF